MPWRKSRDPLFRGDDDAGLAVPEPKANTGIVEHILYLGGAGRASPWQSTSESEDAARHFAGSGRVYRTTVTKAAAHDVGHVGLTELKRLLRGKGHGRAAWSSAFEVMQARRYAEQWAEHLLDFADVRGEVAAAVRAIYER